MSTWRSQSLDCVPSAVRDPSSRHRASKYGQRAHRHPSGPHDAEDQQADLPARQATATRSPSRLTTKDGRHRLPGWLGLARGTHDSTGGGGALDGLQCCATGRCWRAVRRCGGAGQLFRPEVAPHVSSVCVDLFGGYGFTREQSVAKLYCDTGIGTIYEGTSNMLQK